MVNMISEIFSKDSVHMQSVLGAKFYWSIKNQFSNLKLVVCFTSVKSIFARHCNCFIGSNKMDNER